MVANAWRQFWLVEPGDTLGPEWLGQIATRLREGFGEREAAAFEASLQARGELRAALLLLPARPSPARMPTPSRRG
jgi:hypothetical protein